MSTSLALVFAFVALVGWAFGDFYIQKSTRIMGWYKTLFLIGITGGVGLFPFVVNDLTAHVRETYVLLAILSLLILGYTWALFEALRQGKLSIVESAVAIELPFTVILGFMIAGEQFSLTQSLIFILIFIGIGLAVSRRLDHLNRRTLLEKGVLLALFASLLSAITNFAIGSFSQSVSPVFVIWFTHLALGLICGAYILIRGEWRSLERSMRQHPSIALHIGLLDNIAWVAYAYATSTLSISVATTITESYIVLAALLGWFYGHEVLRWHQVLGAAVAFIGVGAFSMTIGVH